MDSEPRQITLAQKVIIESRAGRATQGLSLVLPVCDLCGAVLADQQRHDEWHEQWDDREAPDGQ